MITALPVRPATPRVITVSPAFKLLVLSVLVIMLIALVTAVGVSFVDVPNDMQETLFRTCIDILKTGFGALVGLVGGKAL